MRIAINGFGRIGRNFLRTVMYDAQAKKELEIVAINIGPADKAYVAHMFTYDTLMGKFTGSVQQRENLLVVDGFDIQLIAAGSPSECDWEKYNIDWVIDASGRYTSQVLAQQHLDAGARRVLITAPCKGNVTTIVPGVNNDAYRADRDKIVSLASCTTNALMPMLKILHEAFVIEQAFMTTVHAYTNSQVLIDVETHDPRISRAAALNIIPTTTGAAIAVEAIMPMLKGKVILNSVRVPVATVSLIDLTVKTMQEVTADMVNNAFKVAADQQLQGIISVTDQLLVSSDYMGCDYSVVIDASLTQALGNMSKTFGWYDNEWGYSMRLKDFLLHIA